MRGVFELHDPESPRMSVAVAALDDGIGFAYEGIWFHRDGATLHCDVVSGRIHTADSSEALSLMLRAQDVLQSLREVSPEFSTATRCLEPRFGVNIDDTMGSYPVAKLVDGRVEWLKGSPGMLTNKGIEQNARR